MSFFKASRRIIVDWTMQKRIVSLSFKVNGFFDKEEKPLNIQTTVDAGTLVKTATRDMAEKYYSNYKNYYIPNNSLNGLTIFTFYNDVTVSKIGQAGFHNIINAPEIKTPYINFKHSFNIKWHARRGDVNRRGPRHTGGRIGKLDAASEAGFFHKGDRDKLLELKKTLKDKEKGPDGPKKPD